MSSLAVSFLLASGAQAALSLNLSAAASYWPGRVVDPKFGDFYNDGGSGAYICGVHLYALSDVERPGALSPLHTAYAYQDPRNPNTVSIVADYSKNPPDFYYNNNGGVIASLPEDGSCQGECFAPAPRVNPIGIPGNCTGALNVWPVYPGELGGYSYNTMFELDVQPYNYLNSSHRNVPARRTVPVLFNVTAGTAGYGSKALTAGNSTYFYAWEADSTGFKLAQVPWATRTNVKTWNYWHGDQNRYIQGVPLQYNNSTGNVKQLTGFGGHSFGFDVKYVAHFGTYIITFNNDQAPGSSLYAVYSLSGNIEGPYSDPTLLVSPQYDQQDCGNSGIPVYGIQANWDYYGVYGGSAFTMLATYTNCRKVQNNVNVTFYH